MVVLGSLTVTFVLAADDQVEPHQLPLAAGLAVRNAAAELTGDNSIQLKWPNDVLHQGRKLAGLLCERVRKADLVGIGMNVNLDPAEAPRAIRDNITSLSAIRGRKIEITEALAILAGHLRLVLERASGRSFLAVLREYDQHHALIGRSVCVTSTPGEPSICGRCEGLDSIGRLLLRSKATPAPRHFGNGAGEIVREVSGATRSRLGTHTLQATAASSSRYIPARWERCSGHRGFAPDPQNARAGGRRTR